MKDQEFELLKKGDKVHRVNSLDEYTIIAVCNPVNGRPRYLVHRTLIMDAPMEWELNEDAASSSPPSLQPLQSFVDASQK
jgi:hypothetical protein